MAGQPAIRTRALTKKYGEFTAVNSLDLEVYAGEIFGLLGPNGAGKTTTILMLLGLSEPTEGEAEVVGLDPTRFALEVKRRVGYLPDNVGFYGPLTGRENLRYTARLNGIDRNKGETRIEVLLEQAGLTDAADSRVDTYSRGMRQRLGIADTLIKEPDVVILDEPTVAIDPEGVAEVLALIRSLARDRGVTLLVASHLLHQVQSVCDRVGIFVAGRMVAQGPMAELADRFAEGAVTIEVGVEGDAGDIERVLRSVPGVERLDRGERDPRLWLVGADHDIRDSLSRALVAEGLSLLQLRRHGDELDEIYRRYFQEGEAQDGRIG